MAGGSRGFSSDAEPRRERREKWSESEQRGRSRQRVREVEFTGSMVNTKPTRSLTVMRNPVIAERPVIAAPMPKGARTVGTIEHWNGRGGFGFIVIPDGGRFYLYVLDVAFAENLLVPGLAVEFTATEDDRKQARAARHEQKTGRTGQVAKHVTQSTAVLTREIDTFVIFVREKCCFLKNPDATGPGNNIICTNQVLANPMVQQNVRATVVQTPTGLRALKVVLL